MVKTVKALVYDENYYYGMGGNESFFSKDYSHSIYNKIIFASVDSQKDIFRINIFFRENIVDRIYNNRYLQEIIKKTPILNDIFFGDIYIIAGR